MVYMKFAPGLLAAALMTGLSAQAAQANAYSRHSNQPVAATRRRGFSVKAQKRAAVKRRNVARNRRAHR